MPPEPPDRPPAPHLKPPCANAGKSSPPRSAKKVKELRRNKEKRRKKKRRTYICLFIELCAFLYDNTVFIACLGDGAGKVSGG